MRNQNDTATTIGSVVAHDLIDFEHALDQAFLKANQLSISMIEGRRSAQLSAGCGHTALLSLHGAMGAVLDARSQTIRTHDRLQKLALELGLVPARLGPSESKTGEDVIETPIKKIAQGDPEGQAMI
ncbi:hypothetical protein D3C72_463880 [compost metagenome]|jgi:hypothetical protein